MRIGRWGHGGGHYRKGRMKSRGKKAYQAYEAFTFCMWLQKRDIGTSPVLFYPPYFVVNMASCIAVFKCANEYFPIRVNNLECSLNLAFVDQLKANFCWLYLCMMTTHSIYTLLTSAAKDCLVTLNCPHEWSLASLNPTPVLLAFLACLGPSSQSCQPVPLGQSSEVRQCDSGLCQPNLA